MAAWVGRTERQTDTVTRSPIVRLAATLDVDVPRGPLPLLWHWLYFLPVTPSSELGEDGHPRRGGFLPPLSHRRRMFSGGRVEVAAPLQEGDGVERVATVTTVAEKEGRRGPLVVVTVRHEVTGPAGPAVIEEQDLVYTDAEPRRPGPETGTAPDAAWRADLAVDAVLMFRFSALTFNAHRIHYDAPYSRDVERYPAPVVHGPLVALLLAELARRHGARPRRFRWRARSPAFLADLLCLRGDPGGDLAAYSAGGSLRVEAAFS